MLDDLIKKIVKWHKITFVKATEYSQYEKLKEELDENKASCDYSEVADVFIVACVLWKRFNSSVGESIIKFLQYVYCEEFIKKIVEEKMEINYNRVWRETTEGYYRHEEIE